MRWTERVLTLLDHRFLSRVGNLRTLISVGGVLGLLLVAVVVALVSLFSRAGWVALFFLGLALMVGLVTLLLQARPQNRQVATLHVASDRRIPLRTATEGEHGPQGGEVAAYVREQLDDIARAAVAKARASQTGK